MEMVEIVDFDFHVLAVVRKDTAHEEGLLHKCVIAEIINSQGEMMLVLPLGQKQDAGHYVSPVGGHVSAGETDEEALIREVKEEVGITANKYKRIGQKIFDRYVLRRHENHYFILYEVYSDDEPTLGDEAESYRWFNKNELKRELGENPDKFGDAFFIVIKNFYPALLV